MKRKKRRSSLPLVLILSAILILGAVLLLTPKLKIELIGEKEITVAFGEEYVDPGVKAYFGKKEFSPIITDGKVDTDKIGSYSLTYSVTRKKTTKKVSRTVNVADLTGPVVTVEGEVTAYKGYPTSDITLTYTAIDLFDGDCTSSVERVNNADHIILYATDKKGNKSETKIPVKFIEDENPPVITLKGEKFVLLNPGEKYTDPGATAKDDRDGDITTLIENSGMPDISKKGSYEITYTVTDKGGNKTTAVRYIVVTPKRSEKNPGQKVIYLTFDDGPSPNTPYVLDILKTYNVKATFFVTAQHTSSLPYIERIHKEGHTVAAHTYSHKWEIYKSVDSYFADLDSINSIITKYTGAPSTLIRFPGGSSNRVSANYKKGVMTEIAAQCYAKGYVYFDWNIDSMDTSTSDPAKIVYNITSRLGNGYYNVLMHDTKTVHRQALPQVIRYGLENGYTFLPLDMSSPAPHHSIRN